jgi:tRNA (guanine-N1)-methyltransferase
MKIDILTLFPEMFAPVTSSILGKAGEKGILDIRMTNIRDYTVDKHKRVDEYPFGGGVGMVMQADPVFRTMEAIEAQGKRAIYMSPRGRVLDQELIEQYTKLLGTTAKMKMVACIKSFSQAMTKRLGKHLRKSKARPTRNSRLARPTKNLGGCRVAWIKPP